ncbi:MAG: DNA topoisomerase IB [Acidobacteria bacterium]|nr:DNA topoisomerase IB [Acidobacteriota bacterium]
MQTAAPIVEGLPSDPAVCARAAGLRYVTDARPGIRRLRAGRGFRYVAPDRRTVRDAADLARIRALAIPPAWTGVWICPDPNGHLQATGRDARGRKQYRYHPRWREVRDETKYGRLLDFGQALPAIRARVEADLARPGLPREKVLAAVIHLLQTTLIRVGNDEYARANRSFGLTTLTNDHADVRGSNLRFQFRGKSGKEVSLDVQDRRIARIVQRCQELPGHELFCYVDGEGAVRDIGSGDVNDYLREVSGQEFTAKDFRTWAGSVMAGAALVALGPAGTRAARNKRVAQAIRAVSERLINTPAVCRKHYVHPAVIEAYLDGSLAERFRPQRRDAPLRRLARAEKSLLGLLRRDTARRVAASR